MVVVPAALLPEKLFWLCAGPLSVDAVESYDALRTVRAWRLAASADPEISLMLRALILVAGDNGEAAPPLSSRKRKEASASRLTSNGCIARLQHRCAAGGASRASGSARTGVRKTWPPSPEATTKKKEFRKSLVRGRVRVAVWMAHGGAACGVCAHLLRRGPVKATRRGRPRKTNAPEAASSRLGEF